MTVYFLRCGAGAFRVLDICPYFEEADDVRVTNCKQYCFEWRTWKDNFSPLDVSASSTR